MAIQPENTIVIPAKTADKLWVTYFNISSFSTSNPIPVTIKLTPYSSETGELFNDYTKTLEISDIYALAENDPVIASGISGLYAAIEKLSKDNNLF